MHVYSNQDIQQNELWKRSFFNLAKETFHIDFEDWDQYGYWDNSYVVHCALKNDEVVSNVSTSNATLIINGETYSARQIGTVMTAPNYRQLGYAKALMTQILKEYEHVDYLFLFANKHSASFYEQFGFERISQTKYSMDTNNISFKDSAIKKLNISDKKTRALLLDTLVHRLPVSTKLGVLQNEMIIMFHLLKNWSNNIYYIPAIQTIVIAKQEKDRFILVDFFSKQPILLKELLPYLKIAGLTIEFCFTPSLLDGLHCEEVKGDFFYVKTQCTVPFPTTCYFPDLSKA